MKRNLIVVVCGFILSVFSIQVFAANSSSDNFQVSATVEGACSISTAPADINFGAISVIDGQNHDATSSFGVTCTNTTSYDMELNNGLNANGEQRNMKNGSDLLKYDLYQDAGYSIPWGIGANKESGDGIGSAQNYTIYGRIPAGQTSVPAGTGYADTVTLSVTY